jgi:hypothetical protein
VEAGKLYQQRAALCFSTVQKQLGAWAPGRSKTGPLLCQNRPRCLVFTVLLLSHRIRAGVLCRYRCGARRALQYYTACGAPCPLFLFRARPLALAQRAWHISYIHGTWDLGKRPVHNAVTVTGRGGLGWCVMPGQWRKPPIQVQGKPLGIGNGRRTVPGHRHPGTGTVYPWGLGSGTWN